MILSMEPFMYLLELGIRDMGIDLSRGYRGMSQELLDRPDIGTVSQKRRRKAVPERVSGDFFDDIGSERILLDLIRYEESA